MIEINEISPLKAKELLLESSTIFIDVREKDEVAHEAFDIAGLRNIAYSIFDDNYSDLPKDKNIILACHLGIRSHRVAQFLIVQGWKAEQIFSLQGGIDAWKAAGFAVKKSPRSFTMAKPASAGCCGSSSNSCC